MEFEKNLSIEAKNLSENFDNEKQLTVGGLIFDRSFDFYLLKIIDKNFKHIVKAVDYGIYNIEDIDLLIYDIRVRETHEDARMILYDYFDNLLEPIGMYGYNIFDTDYIVARCIYDKIKYIKDFDKKN